MNPTARNIYIYMLSEDFVQARREKIISQSVVTKMIYNLYISNTNITPVHILGNIS